VLALIFFVLEFFLMANQSPIQVVIVDDHPLIREATRNLLAQRENISLVAEGCCGEDAILLVEQYRPDILLLDISMPQRANDPKGGQFAILDALEKLQAQYPQTKIIILSQYLQQSLTQSMMLHKIGGYLLKSDDLTLKLAEAIEVVHNGGNYSSREVSQIIAKPVAVNDERLTEMQIKILTALARNPTASYSSLASEMNISINTFKWHLKNAFQILGVSSKSAAIVVCIQNNLIPFLHDSYTPLDFAPAGV
jgi:DNA-binding NarL/FixJ family response regulator